jgi:hypothetical protein
MSFETFNESINFHAFSEAVLSYFAFKRTRQHVGGIDMLFTAKGTRPGQHHLGIQKALPLCIGFHTAMVFNLILIAIKYIAGAQTVKYEFHDSYP